MGSFELLFEIDAYHPYFADGQCRALEWVPTEASRQTMANLGMLFRSDSSRMAVYYHTDQKHALALFAAQTEPYEPDLIFKVYAADSNFVNYTALPEADPERLLWLDTARAARTASGRLKLCCQAAVSDQQCALRTHLLVNGILTRPDMGRPPLCVIHVQAAGKANSPLDTAGNVTARSYRLCFDHRQTYWKYYVIGKLATQPIAVRDKAKRWSFDPASTDDLPGSRPAKAFISNATVPLCQTQSHCFQLMSHAVGAEKVMIKKLPAAPVNILHREARGMDVVFVSEIFIHS